MVISSISIPRYPVGVSDLLSTYRVARHSVRGDSSSSQANREQGNVALGPQVTLFDGFGSLLSTQQSFERLFSRVEMQGRLQPGNTLGRYESALKSLGRIEQSSRQLATALEDTMGNGNLNMKQAHSNVPGVQVQADFNAEIGEYHFTLLQPARGQKIASASQSDPFVSLGLEGTIRIEGEDIEVTSQDNLIDLASAINNAFEDEDLDIQATVDPENRLVIEGSGEKPFPLQIVDPDAIAQTLGLVEEDASGNLQVVNELITPQIAKVEIDGETYSFNTNRLSDLFSGLDIEVFRKQLPNRKMNSESLMKRLSMWKFMLSSILQE